MLKGAYTAIVTPFHDNGDLNEEALRENVRFQIESGIDGIIALGTTGESPTLTNSEKERIVTICREETLGKIHLMVGTGTNSTKTTIEESLKAQKLGADSLLIITPYYNKPTQEGIFAHYQALTSAVNIPICVYNSAGRSGVNIQTRTLKEIAKLPHVAAVKEASGDIAQMMDVIASIKRENLSFSVLCGDDALTLPLMTLGGDGVISVISNLVPQKVKALVNAAEDRQYSLALEIHYELLDLANHAFIETNPMPIKALMEMSGMKAGPCRLPLCGLKEESREILKETLMSNCIN